MMPVSAPRVVVAGMAGDSGKTLVSLALLAVARERGYDVATFKKGPDYIDAAWLSWAAGRPARNLDTFLAQPALVSGTFSRHAAREDRGTAGRALNVIEGNRGLFDGLDAAGTHSTAALARLIDAPVLLVLNVRKTTGTAAAFVRGCQALDPRLTFAGVVLNHVSGHRHEAVIREAIDLSCGVPVVGAIPRLAGADALPGRHLGLVPPAEHGEVARAAALVRQVGADYLDFDAIVSKAAASPALVDDAASREPQSAGRPVVIGYVSDSAFSFYYPENLEALEARGATLVPASSLADATLPRGLDALYIGGGFPETHAEAIEGNRALLTSIRHAAADGLPVYAECGGLMLLARSVTWRGRRHEMACVFDVDVELSDSPQGHGYMALKVDAANPFYAPGLEFRAHEFHYSRITSPLPATACAVVRGTGCGCGRDALVKGNAWASYAHVHASGLPEWAQGMVGAAQRHRANRRESRVESRKSRASGPALSRTPQAAGRKPQAR
jgi:cobyrinic acid a,c-diamide synthase